MEEKHRTKLRLILVKRFNVEELRTLCFDLGAVEYDDLSGQGRADKSRELIHYLERRERIPELTALIKKMRPDIEWDDAPKDQKGDPVPLKPTPPPDVTDFVGREKELDALADEIKTLHRAVITGMAGVGKTALASVLARQIAKPEQIFWHTFHAGEGIDTVLWKLASFLFWRGRKSVWRMLYGAQQSGDRPPPPPILMGYLLQEMRGQDYLLCLDNLGQMDDRLLWDQLEQLRQTVEAGELSLLIISRRLPKFVSLIEHQPLSGLNLDDSERLLALRGVSLSADQIADIHARTEGNAQQLMLAIEALKQTHNPARLISHLSEAEDIESYLMDEVDEGLSKVERKVMSAVAVLGHACTRVAIKTILDGQSIRRALKALSHRHLLTTSTNERQEYSQHTLVGAFYYDMLDWHERRNMHHRAGVYCESEEQDALKAALHFERAEEYERAAQLATGDIWVLINQGRAQALQQLLERFTAQQLNNLELWVTVNTALGQIYTLYRKSFEARKYFSKALSVLDTVSDDAVTGQMKILTARACRCIGALLEYESPDEAWEYLCRGLDELAKVNVPEKAFLYIRKGSILMGQGKYASAQDALKKGLELLPAEGHNHWHAAARNNLGTVYRRRGNLQRGKELHQQALDIYEQSHNYWGVISARVNLSLATTLAGDWSEALDETKNALALAERLGVVRHRTNLEMNLGDLHLKLGDPASAAQHLQRCIDLADEHNLNEHRLYAMCTLASLHVQQEQWDTAETCLTQAEQLALELGSKYPLLDIVRSWAQVRLAQGRLKEARVHAAHAVVLSYRLGMLNEEGASLRVWGRVLLASYPESWTALHAFDESLKLLKKQKDPYEAARTKLRWGLALLAKGQTEQGTSWLEQARKKFHELGARHDEKVAKQALKG